MKRSHVGYSVSVALVMLTACTQNAGTPASAAPKAMPASASVFQPTASIQEIMFSEVAPSADVIWKAVATESTDKGPETRQPRTDEEWQKVRNGAITLLEASNLLIVEGRKVAPAAGRIQDQGAPGNLSPEQIQQAIDADRSTFIARAHALHDATLAALHAIDARNADALMEAGGPIDEACEACHVKYWYPESAPPGAEAGSETDSGSTTK